MLLSRAEFPAEKQGVESVLNQPDEPAQNAYIEEVLNLYFLENLTEVRQVTVEWLEGHNAIQPHDALGGLATCGCAAAEENDIESFPFG